MSQQAEAALLIHENCPEKENTKLSNSVKSIWLLFKQLQLALVMLLAGVCQAVGQQYITLVVGVDMQNRESGTWGCCG